MKKTSKYDTIAVIKHLTERLEASIKKDDLEKSYCFSHALEDMVRDLAFELYHDFLEASRHE